FDKDVSAFAFWIQLAGGGPYSGIEVFTGSNSYFTIVPQGVGSSTLSLGDEVVAYGREFEFNDDTELSDFDNVQGTNDNIIRRISTGNALPPFHVDTVRNLSWVPSLSAGTAEQWEGCLVKIKGPGLTVGRSSATGSNPGLGSRAFLVTDNDGNPAGPAAD